MSMSHSRSRVCFEEGLSAARAHPYEVKSLAPVKEPRKIERHVEGQPAFLPMLLT